MKFFLVIYLFFLLPPTFGQDERYFRTKMLGGMVENAGQKKLLPSISITSDAYEIDLDDDGFKESFTTKNIDGLDHIQFYNKNQAKIFESKFDTKGPKSRLYRVESRRISSLTRLLILYYYEGVVNYLTLKNPGYLYFVTIDDKNLNTLSMTKGPMFWLEHKDIDNTYSQRKFDVDIFDFNNDGIKEVRAKYHQISSVFMYQGKGQWQGL
jgi:hypothetical protein